MAYYLLFIFTSFLALLVKNKKLVSIILIVILSVFSGTRYFIDNDYKMYYNFFVYVETSINDFRARPIPLEYCMYIIPNLFKLIFSQRQDVAVGSFMVFALLGVGLKIMAIRKYSVIFFLSVMLYASNLFFIMEMTTIRAGVAAAIFLYGLQYLEKRQHWKFSLIILCCLFFHSSSIIYVLIWALVTVKTKLKYYYIILVVSIGLMIFKINILSLLLLDRVFPRVKIYFEVMEWQNEESINIFNFRILFAIAMIICFITFYKKLKDKAHFDILFKIQLLSVSLFFAFSNLSQVFSLRTFEMLSVSQILLYPMLIYIFRPALKVWGWLIIILFSVLQIYYFVEVSDIFKIYRSWI